jgi:hypothetical protein
MRVQIVVLNARDRFTDRVAHIDFNFRAGWRLTLERARVALGARCTTNTVSEGEWLEHWRAGLDPIGALLEELRD